MNLNADLGLGGPLGKAGGSGSKATACFTVGTDGTKYGADLPDFGTILPAQIMEIDWVEMSWQASGLFIAAFGPLGNESIPNTAAVAMEGAPGQSVIMIWNGTNLRYEGTNIELANALIGGYGIGEEACAQVVPLPVALALYDFGTAHTGTRILGEEIIDNDIPAHRHLVGERFFENIASPYFPQYAGKIHSGNAVALPNDAYVDLDIVHQLWDTLIDNNTPFIVHTAIDLGNGEYDLNGGWIYFETAYNSSIENFTMSYEIFEHTDGILEVGDLSFSSDSLITLDTVIPNTVGFHVVTLTKKNSTTEKRIAIGAKYSHMKIRNISIKEVTTNNSYTYHFKVT